VDRDLKVNYLFHINKNLWYIHNILTDDVTIGALSGGAFVWGLLSRRVFVQGFNKHIYSPTRQKDRETDIYSKG